MSIEAHFDHRVLIPAVTRALLLAIHLFAFYRFCTYLIMSGIQVKRTLTQLYSSLYSAMFSNKPHFCLNVQR